MKTPSQDDAKVGLNQGLVKVVDDHDSCLGLEQRLNIQGQKVLWGSS